MDIKTETIQTVGIFFAVFWAFQINAMKRYRLFNLHYAYLDHKFIGKQIKRWLVGLIANSIAVSGFIVLVILLKNFSGIPLAAGSAISSLFLVGITRLLHAFIATESFYWRYYDRWEYEEILKEIHINSNGIENHVWSHLSHAIVYLFGFPLLGYFIAKLLSKF